MALSVASTNAQNTAADQAIAGLHARGASNTAGTGSSDSPFAALLALLGNSQTDDSSSDSTLATLQQSLKAKSTKSKGDAASDAASQLNPTQLQTVQTPPPQSTGQSTAIIAGSTDHIHDVLNRRLAILQQQQVTADTDTVDADASATSQPQAPAALDTASHASAKSTASLSAASQSKLDAALAAAGKASHANGVGNDAQKTTPAADPSTPTPIAPTDLAKLQSAALSHASKHAEQTETPAAKTEAQALPIHFDTSNAKTNVQIDSDLGGNSSSQNGNSHSAKDQTADTARSLDTASAKPMDASANAVPNSNPAPATNIANAANGVSGIAGATSGGPSSHLAVELKVSAQTSSDPSATQPNLGALAVSIVARSKDGDKEFNISMDPPELGRVDVRLSVDSSGKAQAHLTADQPQTLQLLQNDRATLENSLKDAGIDLANNGLNFSLKGQDQQNQQNASAFAQRSRSLTVNAVQSTDASNSSSSTSLAPGDSRLDIRV